MDLSIENKILEIKKNKKRDFVFGQNFYEQGGNEDVRKFSFHF